MKISILLPYKENFSPEYPGAVSLFVFETTKISKFKEKITVKQPWDCFSAHLSL